MPDYSTCDFLPDFPTDDPRADIPLLSDLATFFLYYRTDTGEILPARGDSGELPTHDQCDWMIEALRRFRDRIPETEITRYNEQLFERHDKEMRSSKPEVVPKLPPVAKSGYIYLIKGTWPDQKILYKIGRTTQTIDTRLAQLQKDWPHIQLESLLTFPTEDVVKTERDIHTIFKDNRVYAEWFDLTRQELMTLWGAFD